jgi:valyl-tRNA synthetase
MKVGRRLAVKILNASKFALAELPPPGSELTHPLDRALVGRLAEVVEHATQSFDAYDYTRALERTEEFFWWYCDYYLELVKGRRYDPAPGAADSVSLALRLSLSVLQRLFAPVLPFVCEEVWSWWQTGSIHRAAWPESSELTALLGERGEALPGAARRDGRAQEDLALELTADVLRAVRKAKSDGRHGMRAPVQRLAVTDTPERLAALSLGLEDLRAAGAIAKFELLDGDELSVSVEIAPDAPE